MVTRLEPGEELHHDLGETGLANWNRFAAVNNEFVPMHMDDAAARAAGFPAAFAMGNLQWAYVHRALRAWLGGQERIEHVRLRFVAPMYRGRAGVHARAVSDVRLDVQVRVDEVVTAQGAVTLRT